MIVTRGKIEVGTAERHTVEFINNGFTGVQEIIVDGKTVHKKFHFNPANHVIEVGIEEKHRVRIQFGWKEAFQNKVAFFVDDAPLNPPGKSQVNPMFVAVSALATVLGFALGWYMGAPFVLVFCIWLGVYLLLSKALKLPRTPLTLVLAAMLLAYAAWFTGAMFATQNFEILFDTVILLACAVWILARPSKPGCITVLIYQGLGLLVNGVQLFSYPPGTSDHKALTTHVVIRLLTFGLACAGLKELRKKGAPLK